MNTLLNTEWLWPFLAASGLLVAACSASLAWAARSNPASHGAPAAQGHLPQQLALLIGLPLAVIALYAALGHPRALDPDELSGKGTAQMEAMVETLAQRLAQDPADLEGWLMLARSRKVMGQHAQAAQAYARADALDPARVRADPDRLADWIEARMLSQDRQFDATSLALLALAMERAPQHPGVLMMRGLAALDRGDRPAAARAFAALRDQYAEGSADRSALDEALARMALGEDPRQLRAAATPGAPPSATR